MESKVTPGGLGSVSARQQRTSLIRRFTAMPEDPTAPSAGAADGDIGSVTPLYYSYTHGDAFFIGLDATEILRYDAFSAEPPASEQSRGALRMRTPSGFGPGVPQFDWLKRTLEAEAEAHQWRVVFFH